VPPQGGRKHPHQDFLQINTANILFICGGAFEGLENHIEKRLTRDHVRLGFQAQRGFRGTKRKDELMMHVTHDDLLEFGLIPEFVGRLPMVVGLQSLDESALIKILTEPKNALVKQYERYFAMDGVDLVFTDDALKAIAETAIKHKTGARGLRTVLEETLMEVMYDIPGRNDVKKCVVNADSVLNGTRPLLLTRGGQEIDPNALEHRETA
ncbi:MAG TPA: AAA family ATPase, partial [Tepidiformaceae bacterium]|nr:AAA family ATPase [Tepidiformaceae bacterium]